MPRDRERFRELMAELEAASEEYLAELRPATTPLGSQPVEAHTVDWERWERVKERYDAADGAVLRFLRGEDLGQ